METYVSYIFSIPDPDNEGQKKKDADGNVIYFMSPPTFQRIPGFDPPESVIAGWNRFPNPISTINAGCGEGGGSNPNPNDGPVWKNLTVPKIIRGKDYVWVVPFDSAQAADGHSISTYLTVQLPPYLNSTLDLQGRITISGSVPLDATAKTFTLKAVQDDQKFSTKTVEGELVTVTETTIGMAVQHQGAIQQAIVRIAPDGDTVPKVSIRRPGENFSDAVVAIKGNSAETVMNKQFWFYVIYTGLVTQGIYTFKVEYLDQTLYGSMLLGNTDVEGLPVLSTTPPTSDVYTIDGPGTLAKGTSGTYALKKEVSGTPSDVTGETYELSAVTSGVTLTSGATAELTLADHPAVFDGQQIIIIAKIDGNEVSRKTVVVRVPVVTPVRVLAVDIAYIPPEFSNLSRASVYILLSGEDIGQLNYEALNADGTQLYPPTGFNDGDYYTDQQGYSRLHNINNLPPKVRFSVRPKNNPTAVITFVWTRPSATVPRKLEWSESNGTGGGSVIGVPATIQFAKANSDIINLMADWTNGAWRLRDAAQPNVPTGYTKYYFISGQTGRTSLPTTGFNPGDEIQIYCAIAQTNSPHTSIWSRSGTAQIIFPKAP